MLTDNEAVIVHSWNGRMHAIQKEGAPVTVQWNEAQLATDVWAIPKGAANAENAQKFSAFITLPVSQARLSYLIPYGSVNTASAELMTPGQLENLPTAPAYLEKMFIRDIPWWVENREAVLDYLERMDPRSNAFVSSGLEAAAGLQANSWQILRMENLVPIGRFSKICRLSVSSLRYYDELGLLRPALVDPDTSYRYYLLSQVRVAETIRLLRALDMPLDDVRRFLAEDDPAATRELLNRHQRRMEDRVEEGQRILSYLHRLQGEDDFPASAPVRARHFEDQPAMCVRACVPEPEVPGTWRALAAELRSFLGRCNEPATGPVGAIFPDPVHLDEAVNMTVFVPVAKRLEPRGRIKPDIVPGGLAATIVHLGPYALLDRSYEQLVSWMQRHGHEMAGPPRELFWLGPTETNDPNSYETEVVWPVR